MRPHPAQQPPIRGHPDGLRNATTRVFCRFRFSAAGRLEHTVGERSTRDVINFRSYDVIDFRSYDVINFRSRDVIDFRSRDRIVARPRGRLRVGQLDSHGNRTQIRIVFSQIRTCCTKMTSEVFSQCKPDYCYSTFHKTLHFFVNFHTLNPAKKSA